MSNADTVFTYTPQYRSGLTFTWEGGEYIETTTNAVLNVWDHANGRPTIERTQEAFEAECDEWVREQDPADGEIGDDVDDLPLSLLLRADGVTITSHLIAMGIDASGWVHREYGVTLGFKGRTFEGKVRHGGEEGDAPGLTETVQDFVSGAWDAEVTDGYEDWASDFGGPDPANWMPEETYRAHLDNAKRLRAFLGGRRFVRYALADHDA
jgi:hypothetical protein